MAEEKEHEVRKWLSENEAVQIEPDDLIQPSDPLSAQYVLSCALQKSCIS